MADYFKKISSTQHRYYADFGGGDIRMQILTEFPPYMGDDTDSIPGDAVSSNQTEYDGIVAEISTWGTGRQPSSEPTSLNNCQHNYTRYNNKEIIPSYF